MDILHTFFQTTARIFHFLGAVQSGRKHHCASRQSLDSKEFSAYFWQRHHLVLQDAGREHGRPSAFITKSPCEWSFSPGLSWFYSLYSFLLLPSVFKNVIFISFLCYPSTYQFTYIRHNIYQASFTVHNLLSLQFQLYINSNISWHVLYYVNYNFYFSNYKRIIFINITKTMFLVQRLLT